MASSTSTWVRGKCVGRGAFGTVNVAVTKSDGYVFAVKSVDLITAHTAQIEALENEIRILRLLPPSPHVITFLGDDVTCERSNWASTFRNLHLEYMPRGTVADLDPADVDERLVRRYASCLVHALRHLHALGVVHCDVKGRNVLVSDDGGAVKLADFGSAAEYSGESCVGSRGSPMWMAPEVVRREYQGPESDVWSLGCTVIEMVTGKLPWEDRGADTLSRIGYSSELPEFPTRLSELGRDFLEKCLRREKSERWSCDQLLQHPFLVSEGSIKVLESSPRCVLDWVDSGFDSDEEEGEMNWEGECVSSAKGRIGKLATGIGANWETQGWVVVRALASESDEEATIITEATGNGEEGVVSEFGNDVARVESGIEVGTCGEYSDFCGRTGEKVGRVKWERRKNKRLVWRRWKLHRQGGGCGNKWEDELDKNGIKGIFTIYSLYCKIFNLYYYLIFSVFIINKLCFSSILSCFTACNKNVVKVNINLI